MDFNIDTLKQTTWLALYSALLLGCYYMYQQQGASAVVIIMLLMVLFIAFKLLSIHQRSKHKIELIIRAIVNNDPMLGFARNDPLADKIAQISERLQSSRLEAQTQAQYLQTLLIHIDIAILVLDDNNKIVHKNPASEKLLGRLGTNINPTDQIGQLLTQQAAYASPYKTTMSWQNGEQMDTLSVHVSHCKIQGKSLKLVSIQSIYQALAAKEQQAYKRLTKVLTHEVANSIAPLASLADTAMSLLPDELTFDDPEDKDDINEALTTLSSRTAQLSNFIKRFHQITSLPKPQLQEIQLPALIERSISLFKAQAQSQETQLLFNHQSSCLVLGDSAQIEQALINLIKNALEAVEKSSHKEVCLTLFQQENLNGGQHLLLDIQDSGSGIAPHVIDQVFVPFFTTKKQGSGIGLSLSRQIMIQHGGDLKYVTKPDSGACFRLIFG